MTSMYRLPPIIPANMEFDLPSRMYNLPMIQKSNVTTSNSQATECGKPDDQVLKDLERRQEAILAKLESLKLEVSTLKSGKPKDTNIIEDKLAKLFETIRKIERLFATKTPLQIGTKSSSSAVKDIVIRASPQYPPHSVPILCSQLQQSSLNVFTSAHIHSSVKCLPNSLEDFLPMSNCNSRSKANLCVTLIWKDVGKDVELVLSPTSSSVIRGESNVLRYVARRFGLFQSNHTEKVTASLEELMDSLYHEKLWGSFSIASTLEPALKSKPFLGDKSMSTTDLYAYSLAVNEKGKWSQAIKDWMKRCEEALKVPLNTNLKVNPNTRQRKPSTSRNVKSSGGKLHKKAFISQNDGIVEAGQTLTHQWPEIPSVYLANEAMIEHLTQDHIALVSEKLDGSNLSVSSAGIVASRRKILLVNPSPADLEKTKFAGESLTSLKPILVNIKSMLKSVFNPMLPNQKPEIIVYGEWVQEGTASSKEDKFNYKERRLDQGKLYGFGLGIYFRDAIDPADLQNVKYILKKHRFAVASHSFKEDMVTLMLNGELKRLFEKYHIPVVPVLHTLPFTKIFAKLADELLQQKVEGYILTIPSKGQVFKWKGCEESDPRRVEAFVDLASACSQITEAIMPLNKVLQESLLYNAHGRKRYFDPSLVSAFNSARSKFPRLSDVLADVHDEQSRKKIIQGYKFTLADEITKDFGKVFGCTTAESIETFIKHEM